MKVTFGKEGTEAANPENYMSEVENIADVINIFWELTEDGKLYVTGSVDEEYNEFYLSKSE